MRCCCSLDKVGSSRGYQGRSVCCAGDREKCCTGNGDTFGLATCLIRSSLRKMGYGRESLFVDKVLVKGLRQHKRSWLRDGLLLATTWVLPVRTWLGLVGSTVSVTDYALYESVQR